MAVDSFAQKTSMTQEEAVKQNRAHTNPNIALEMRLGGALAFKTFCSGANAVPTKMSATPPHRAGETVASALQLHLVEQMFACSRVY